MSKNFPDTGKETDIQIQETHRIPKKNWKKLRLRHIMSKADNNEKILKAGREKQLITYIGALIRL